MKLNVVFALVALFAAQALCSESRTLLQKSATAGGASILKAEDGWVGANTASDSKGGKSFVTVTGYAKAEEKAKSDFIYFFKVVLDKYYLKKVCKKTPWAPQCCPKAKAYIYKELEAKAYAIAAAYATVTVDVYVKGNGKSCGVGDAKAHEKAEAFVKICAKAIAIAKVGYSESKALTFVKGYQYLFAEAFAKAWSAACVTDGFAKTYQKAFAAAISKVCVELVLKLVAYEGCTLGKTYNGSDLDVKEKEEVYAGTESKNVLHGTGFSKTKGFADADTINKGKFFEKYFP